MSKHTSLNTTSQIAAQHAQHAAAIPGSSATQRLAATPRPAATPCENMSAPSCSSASSSASTHDIQTPHAALTSRATHERHTQSAHKTLQRLNRKRAGYRAETEDDDGYDPYSDRTTSQPLFERNPWD
jgi:hypothetical protein